VWEKVPRPGTYPATIDEIERRLARGRA